MATQDQVYLPIPGVEYPIIPKVYLRGNLFDTQLYAQKHGLVVLPSRDINRVAEAVRAEKPNEDFIRYVREHTDLNDKDVIWAYRQLHDDMLIYWIRAREILMWVAIGHPGLDLRRISRPHIISVLLNDYKVVYKDKLDTRGITPNPEVKVRWPTRDGTLTKELSELLGAPYNTYVWSQPSRQPDGELKALIWGFWDNRPYLSSVRGPWGKYDDCGSLLGRRPQTKQ